MMSGKKMDTIAGELTAHELQQKAEMSEIFGLLREISTKLDKILTEVSKKAK